MTLAYKIGNDRHHIEFEVVEMINGKLYGISKSGETFNLSDIDNFVIC